MMDSLMDDGYDPLAPVHFGPEPEDEPAADGEAGFSDPDHLVRVWTTDGVLTRVKVSPVWHLKVGHKTLDECFAAALAAARVRVVPAVVVEAEPDLTGVDFSGLPRFGRDPFTTFRLAIDNFNRRWAEAADRHRDRPLRAPSPVSAELDGVTVSLDADGHPVGVEFEEDWLDDVNVGEIADAVLAAARKARAAYRPAEPEDDELANLALEHEILMAGFAAMLTGKVR